MKKLTIALGALAFSAAATVCMAQTAAVVPAQPTLMNTSIDTWIEGTVLSVDANGQKFAIRGVKLPYATAEAQMIAAIEKKTKDLPADQKAKKTQEIQQSWADKLNKAKAEKLATSLSNFKLSLPDKANLVIMSEKDLPQNPNAAVTEVSASSSSASASSSSNSGSSVSASAQVAPGQASAYTSKELTAIKTLKDLKVGDKVKVGFDSGMIYSTAYLVLEEGTAIR